MDRIFRGYLALYDRVKEEAYDNDYLLDYPPLRLLTMAIWTEKLRDGFPWVDNEHPKLVNPLLKINLVCELVSAAAIFFLVRLCVQRSVHAPQPGRPGYRENIAPQYVVSPLPAWPGSNHP